MQFDESFSVAVVGRGAGVVVLDDQQRILLVKEKQGAKKDLWHIPMGTVEEGETLEQAAVREAFEESGLHVQLKAFIGAYIGKYPDDGLVLRHAWLAEVADGQTAVPHLADEIAEARYFSQAEFYQLYEQRKIRMHHTRLFYEDALLVLASLR
ncbi:NUDIX domain-containing protein [Reinekea marinisedimentorum]|uniref:ADP-ribose pyrophosphatase YjhB (NUDIX family) n=1 Tax=Reinekea marinisedimentorum TaxID=230495 RepID=A0A4R3IC17_9GAMM|nr:NUDIX domain-containing protein [Reinekea marinisedimentorum]TCS43685.1 ADP-ribose pyrophosphatase YjhB (NUDIX family) [Reinekea marinisedimentorum]